MRDESAIENNGKTQTQIRYEKKKMLMCEMGDDLRGGNLLLKTWKEVVVEILEIESSQVLWRKVSLCIPFL